MFVVLIQLYVWIGNKVKSAWKPNMPYILQNKCAAAVVHLVVTSLLANVYT